MSYDIAVFEPDPALRDRDAFLNWFEDRVQWGERANDPTHATPRLQAWFQEIIKTFPPMNGPNRPPFEDLEAWDRAVDYCFAGDMIYIAISGMRGEEGFTAVSKLAGRFGIGLYTVSDSGEVWFPLANGLLEVAFQTSA